MCAEKIQRIFQAILLGLIMGFAANGIAGEHSMLQIAFLLQLVMIILLLIGGFSGICPGLIILKGILPSCDDNKKEKK